VNSRPSLAAARESALLLPSEFNPQQNNFLADASGGTMHPAGRL
jgi:hypothetical protein